MRVGNCAIHEGRTQPPRPTLAFYCLCSALCSPLSELHRLRHLQNGGNALLTEVKGEKPDWTLRRAYRGRRTRMQQEKETNECKCKPDNNKPLKVQSRMRKQNTHRFANNDINDESISAKH